MGGIDDPEDGKAVAGTIFTAVIVYAVRHRLVVAPTPNAIFPPLFVHAN